jgi:hypothetical protein
MSNRGQSFFGESLQSRSRELCIIREQFQECPNGDEWPRRPQADRLCVTRPPPFGRPCAETRLDGVQCDVSARCELMGLGLDEFGVVSPSEDVSSAAVSAIVGLGVEAVEPLNAACEITTRCGHHQVIVRCHQAVGKARPGKALNDVGQQRLERALVDVVREERTTCACVCGDVIRPARYLNPRSARHSPTLALARTDSRRGRTFGALPLRGLTP